MNPTKLKTTETEHFISSHRSTQVCVFSHHTICQIEETADWLHLFVILYKHHFPLNEMHALKEETERACICNICLFQHVLFAIVYYFS